MYRFEIFEHFMEAENLSRINPLVPNAILFIQFQNPFNNSFEWVKTEFHFFFFFLNDK